MILHAEHDLAIRYESQKISVYARCRAFVRVKKLKWKIVNINFWILKISLDEN